MEDAQNALDEEMSLRAKTARAKRLRICGLLGLGAVCGLVALSWGLRQESVCGDVLDAAFKSMERRTGLSIERGTIEPAGLTGLEIQALRIIRPKDQSTLVEVETVRVYPDVWALFSGRLALDSIETQNARVDLRLGGKDTSDLAFFEALRSTPTPNRTEPTQTTRSDWVQSVASTALKVHNARIHVRDLSGRIDPLVAEATSVHARSCPQLEDVGGVCVQGQVNLEGYGEGRLSGELSIPARLARLRVMLDARVDATPVVQRIVPESFQNTNVWVRGVEVAWPARVAMMDVHLNGLQLSMPWKAGESEITQWTPQLNEVEAWSLGFGWKGDEVMLHTVDASLTMNDGAQRWDVPVGDVDLYLEDGLDRFVAEVRMRGPVQDPLHMRARWDAAAERIEVTAQLRGMDLAPYSRMMPSALAQHVHPKGGQALGRVALSADLKHNRMDLDLDVATDLVEVTAPLLHSAPVSHLPTGLRGHLRIELEDGSIGLENAAVRLGALELGLEGRVREVETDEYTIQASLRSKHENAQDVFASIPQDLLPALQGYVLRGPFALRFDLDVDTRNPQDLTATGALDVDSVEIVEQGPHARIQDLMHAFKMPAHALPGQRRVGPMTPFWTPYNEIAPALSQSVVHAEDSLFWKHSGFDVRGIRSALVANIKARRVVRGGSTISQQLIKNLYLNHDRTASRKVQEAFLTWVLERTIPKERIMEVYLNILHWGPSTYGVRQASRVLFDKKPHRLSMRECVFLASILSRPNHYTRLYAYGTIPEHRTEKMLSILENLKRAKVIEEGEQERLGAFIRKGIISIATSPAPRLAWRIREDQKHRSLETF